jgi:tetratricopeptide (TPR) repeat protein
MHDNATFWEEVEAIFADAVELAPAERARLLDRRCEGRPRLREEVLTLLAAHDTAGGFLAVEGSANAAGAAPLPQQAIGPFRLIEPIGEGGMGVVYRAERADGEFTQQVAIKLLDASLRGDALRRFRAERQILATLHHPHIVTLLDGGLTETGRGYLVMEYVDGVPITAWCAAQALDLSARLALFRDVCAAVQHAHSHGVVHRDLKPANILVAGGLVKVLDFGIARLLDADGDATAEAFRALTPNYASPEQLRGLPVTTASDIYALGVLLYELVAGVRPYDTAHQPLDRVLTIVGETEPRRPSAAAADQGVPYDRRRLRGDLDAIVLKAMAKDPARRYASAQELSEDVGRHLAGRPVLAREPSLWYSAAAFARRHRAAVTAACISLAALVAALGVSVWQTRVALRERDRAAARFNDTRELARALIFDIHDQIKPLPGSTPVRKTIVAEALKYLVRLEHDAGDDDGLRLELARAYHRIGNVQGKPSEPNLGDTPGARRSLEAAAALLRPLVKAGRASADATVELAEIDMSLTYVASALEARDEARAATAEAVALARAHAARVPGDAADRLLGSALFTAAAQKQGEDALPIWREAGAVFERLLAGQPDNQDRQRNVALVEKYVGTVYSTLGRMEDAAPHFERALALDEQRLARDAANRQAQLDVAIDLANLAMARWRTGRLPEAATGYERALEIRTRLAASDPADMRARRFEEYGHTRLSSVYYDLGRYDDSLAHARRAVEIGERLASDDAYRLDLLEALNALGRAQVRTGAAASGCRSYARARTVAAGLASRGTALGPSLRGRFTELAKSADDGFVACQAPRK